MPRLVHKSTDGLPEQAWQVMHAGFRRKKTFTAIARDLAELDFDVPERTIARRSVDWRQEEARRKAAREQMEDMVAAMKSGDMTSAEMIQALAIDGLMSDPDSFAAGDPIKVQRLNLRAEELRLKEEELDLKRRQQTLNEEKFAAIQERERRAIEVAGDKGESLTPDERLREIQAIYGIKRGNG